MIWTRRPAVLACVVALIGAAVFVPSIGGGWIYDDHLLIPENSYVHSFQWWPRWFVTDFWDVGEEFVRLGTRIAYWRPAINATYAIDWQVGGGEPLWFHITNYLWHAAASGLAFLVLRRWLNATWPAFAVAILFAVHPTKAESVAWIAGRTDVICMVAVLLVSQGIARRLRGERGGLVLEFVGTLLAYTSKEQAIVLPAFAAIEAWVAAGRPAIDRAAIVRMLKVAAPQLVIALAYLVVRKLVMPIAVIGMAPSSGASFADHAQAVLETIGRFITLTTVPHELSIQHGLVRVVEGQPLHSLPHVVLGGVALVCLVVIAWRLRRTLPVVTVGIAFYLLTLAPTMNIVNTQMATLVSERFLYLPYLGIALVVGGLVARWPTRWTYAVLAIVIALLATQAIRRALDYGDEEAFWARELALHPESAEARRARVRAEIRAKRYRAALIDTLELTRKASQQQDVAVASDTAQLLADLSPDHDRASLETLDAFAADMITRKQPAATLQLKGLTFTIPTQTKLYERDMGAYELRLIALRTSLRSRLGDDAGAVEIAKQGLAKCPRCLSSVMAGALAFARAGNYEDAFTILDSGRGYLPGQALAAMREMIDKGYAEHKRAQAATGPAQLQARASELAALELWGRAYDVLAPYKDQIKGAPKFVKGFAELAFRAGEPQVAREVLAGTMSPAEIETTLGGWARTMGWVD